jgi:hypothetical protein
MRQVDPPADHGYQTLRVGLRVLQRRRLPSIVAVVPAPLVHRFLHRFHLELDDARGGESD